MHCITQYTYCQLILYNENTSLTSVIMLLRPQAFLRDFHKPPRFTGDLITIFLKTMVLLITKYDVFVHGDNVAALNCYEARLKCIHNLKLLAWGGLVRIWG